MAPAEHDVKRLEERKLQIVNRDISIKKLSAREQNAKREIRSSRPPLRSNPKRACLP
ncbi:hypothetical protein [Methanogenium cariaci]|uniref:hypothetical protein n=1 Tax=Methanogenium cariaci TaxID=2197 RepID=UPI001FE1ED35|nr:hypothetical protein [Methanogenium cariaci]